MASTVSGKGIDHYKRHRLLSEKASTVKNGIACLRKGKLQRRTRGRRTARCPTSHKSTHCFRLCLPSGRVSLGDRSLLRMLYWESFRKHIFLAFCNEFESHYCMFPYILLRRRTLLVILRHCSVMAAERANSTDLKNS